MENKQKERTNNWTNDLTNKKWQTQARTDTKRRLLPIIIGHNMRFTFVYDVGRCAWHQFLRLHFHTLPLSLPHTQYMSAIRKHFVHVAFRVYDFQLFIYFSLALLFIMCTLKTEHNVCVHIVWYGWVRHTRTQIKVISRRHKCHVC